ncbi:hypothetical protein AXX17_AT5G47780 [Arabidopsis thaliana]|uniref:Uncharacterized protein n=1 Tax=Arabidopsis thaliana TaxID=3702 RepID=A0A178US15_ARATH|nr:hypothetical protein AXX17_AT5G47780 [Arabidopsis thaliana]
MDRPIGTTTATGSMRSNRLHRLQCKRVSSTNSLSPSRKRDTMPQLKIELKIVGLYPKGSPSRNSRRPKTSLGLGGGLEIVFNQQ